MLLVCYLRTLGLTWGKVQAYLGEAFGIRVSHGGLVHMEAAVAGALGPLYRRLLEEVRRAKAVHADDTSWRIDGEDHWPWILLAKGVSYYAVRDTRGRRVVEEALGPGYGGVVVSDFYPTLAGLPYGQQKCLVHLLREIKRFEGRPDFRPGREWRRVRMRVKRLVTEAVEGRELEDPGGRRALKERLVARAAAVARLPRGHRYARTLARLVGRYRESLFTFLDHGEVSWENNPAERALRPMVVNRKTSYGSRSTARAGRRCVLQSVAETARLRGESFFDLAGGELGPGPPRPIPGL
jgi:transposase